MAGCHHRLHGREFECQLVKNLPAVRESWVPSLGWEDPLEKGTAPHSSILAWRIPWTVHRVAESRTQLSDFFHFSGALGSSGVQLGVLVTWAQRRPVSPTGQSSRG